MTRQWIQLDNVMINLSRVDLIKKSNYPEDGDCPEIGFCSGGKVVQLISVSNSQGGMDRGEYYRNELYERIRDELNVKVIDLD